MQLVQLLSASENFKEQGVGIAGVSYDSEAILRDFAKRHGISFPLLADPNSETIRAYGVLFILAAAAGIAIGVFAVNTARRLRPTASAGARTERTRAAAPKFALRNIAGKKTSLAEFKGKVVLVNFWATWCGPCRVEIPWLISMQQKYGPQEFTVLGLAMDDEKEAVVSPFVAKETFSVSGKQLPMNYPILIGTSDVAEKFGGLLGFPTSVLVAKDGKIIKHVTGIISEEEMSKLIESELSASGGK